MRQTPEQPDGFIVGVTCRPPLTDAEVCRTNGWFVNTILEGDEGFGLTRIRITAIGERHVLARKLSHNGVETPSHETLWTVQLRDWKRAN